MTEVASPPPKARSRRPRFSLGSLLLVVTIVCLTAALVVTHRKVAQIERQLAQKDRELATLQPLSAKEVARQFEKSTTLGPIATTVKDVRYSTKDDAYKVRFSWVDPATSKTWTTEVKLVADGYGAYFGQIRSKQFCQPLGYKDGFSIAVKTPSPLQE